MVGLIISLLVFFGGLLYFRIKYGWTESISAIAIEANKRGDSLIPYSLWQGSYALIAMVISDNNLLFLSGLGIIAVGIMSPMYKDDKETGILHYVGAGIAVASSQLYAIINGFWYITACFVGLSAIPFIFKIKQAIYIMEVLAFIAFCFIIYFVQN